MEWSKNAVGNSMGGVEKNEVPQQGGGGAEINWNSPFKEHNIYTKLIKIGIYLSCTVIVEAGFVAFVETLH